MLTSGKEGAGLTIEQPDSFAVRQRSSSPRIVVLPAAAAALLHGRRLRSSAAAPQVGRGSAGRAAQAEG